MRLAALWGFSTVRPAKRILSELIALGKVSIESGFLKNELCDELCLERQSLSEKRASSGSRGGQVSAKVRRNSRRDRVDLEAIAAAKSKQRRGEERREEKESSTLSRIKPVKVRPSGIPNGTLAIQFPGEMASAPVLPDEVKQAVDFYSDAAKRHPTWSVVHKITSARRAAVAARIRDAGGLDGWKAAVTRAERSKFLCGEVTSRDGRAFAMKLDFLCQESSFIKLIEGAYDDKQSAKQTFAQRYPQCIDPYTGRVSL